ncbi:helix-turn-helix domain-containing protein [Phytoactinopolyspora mesophila]|uniref:Helix-turn-helix domain-containing protein n=1 Tax=Phytoactinopolyspora mesophila TaxID=2650750 RepID=A0A7K3LZB5_9ACTN|nr:helix-turn-helix domain-containing protein [Phytoactinopolyspora mesophila]
MSDNELGLFLRTRREGVLPSDVGLPTGPRRRTPGLRRSELATLAGVSVEYLTRIEQGRDRHPSSQVLGALADALRLPSEERFHLLVLAKSASGDGLCAGSQPPAQVVRPTVRALLDLLEPTPAVLLNRLNDVLAWTAGYRRCVAPPDFLDGESPNLLRYVFTDARAHDVYPDWDDVADQLVANLRAEQSGDDPHASELTDELSVTAGAPFTDRMTAPPALPERSGVDRLVHPDAGELRLAYETLALPDPDSQRLVVYLPADDATAASIDELTGRRPGALRAVAS